MFLHIGIAVTDDGSSNSEPVTALCIIIIMYSIYIPPFHPIKEKAKAACMKNSFYIEIFIKSVNNHN